MNSIMRVLVTGINGIVGHAVIHKLVEQSVVITGLDKEIYSKHDFPVYECDIRDREKLIRVIQEIKPEYIVHLAARTDLKGKWNIENYSSNTIGVQNVIDAIRAISSVKRVIYTSSQLVCKIGYVPQSDTDYCPPNLYGASKVETEKIIRKSNGGDVEWCIVRPTTVWGPYMNQHYQKMLKYIEKRFYFHIGIGSLRKSYSYSGNLAHQYYKLLTAPIDMVDQKTFYLADYNPIDLKHYTNLLQEKLKAPSIPSIPLWCARFIALMGDIINKVGVTSFPFNSFRLKNIMTEYIVDTSNIEKICGSLPYSIEEGIAETVRWYQNEKRGQKD